ncbi:MAG: methyltransferase domain-containing protein [Candidatus Theseobacter exili]|nr:methyltransferase domain-containing protein [Candidatus Theseobacter exili]
MRLSDDSDPYLSDKSFSAGLKVSFEYDEQDKKYCSRIDILKEMCFGKRVVHAGCVDHDIDTIIKKTRRDKWLHGILCDCAERCFGVDIDEEGVRYIHQTLGISDVECSNILECNNKALMNESWDCILIPEVLEHCDNPVDFLQKIHEKFKRNIRRIILTVPNAFSRENYRNTKKGIESVNSDHRYWFTPYTLTKVVSRAGFIVDELRMCRSGIIKKRTFLKNLYYRTHPLVRNGMILIGSFNKKV